MPRTLRSMIPIRLLLPILCLLPVLGCGASAVPDAAAQPGAPPPADAPPGLGEPGTMSDSVVHGTAMLDDRQPAAHADVYVGVAEGGPGDPRDCERPGAVLALTRTSPDGHGRWSTRLPRAEAGAGTPACLFIVAEVRDTSGPLHDAVRAHAWTGVRIDGTPVHLALETVRTEAAGRGLERRPDAAWIPVVQRIPGWAGFVFNGGPCRVVVSLVDLRRQAAARAYVDSVLQAERRGSEQGCGSGGRTYQFRQVEYDWAQLQRWYGRVGILANFKGMRSSDVDEGRNRIVLSFADPAGARAARRALPLLRVPPAAVVIEAPEQAEVMPSDTFGPAAPRLGTRLGGRWWPGSPAWSADGREILFVTVEGSLDTRHTVRAVELSSRGVREVAGVRGMNTGGSQLRQGADGAVYAAIALPGSAAYALWRIPPGDGEPVEVARGLSTPSLAMDAAGRRFAFPWTAPRGSRMDESLVVLDRETGRQDTVRGAGGGQLGRLLELSPDGGALAYTLGFTERPEDVGVWLYDLRTRQHRQLWRAPEGRTEGRTETAAAVRWEGGAPRLLLVRRSGPDRAELAELDPASGRRTRLGAVPIAPGEFVPEQAAWTADGSRVAYWAPVAHGPQSCGGGMCISRRMVHWRLYAWQPGRTDPQVLADVAADEGAAWLAFSPDGRRIAYVLNGALYAHELP